MNIARDDGMSFGTAVALLERGGRVARKGWNGKGMFLFYVPAHAWSLPHLSVVPGKVLPYLPFIAMKTAGDEIVPWLASQTDVLAHDWCEVETIAPRTLAPGEQLVAVEDRGPFFEQMTDAQFARLRALYEADARREPQTLRLTLPVEARFSEGTEAAFDAIEALGRAASALDAGDMPSLGMHLAAARAHVVASRAAPARDTEFVVRIEINGDLFGVADSVARVVRSEAQRALHDDFPR